MATREARPQTCLVCSKYVYQLRYIIRLSKVMEKNEKIQTTGEQSFYPLD